MGSWRDLAADVFAARQADDPALDQPAQADPETVPEPSPRDELFARVGGLSDLHAPRVKDRAAWAQVVRDAQGLVRDGWAGRALALGWSPEDLFGTGPQDSHDFEGLAVWLRGRKIILIDEHCAVTRDDCDVSYFNRGGLGHGKDASQQPVMLWHFGRTT